MSFLGYDKLRRLVYTEKSNGQVSAGKYSFEVTDNSTKSQISSVVKKIFGVDVVKVNMLNSKKKPRAFKGIKGEKKAFKKAIVTLKEGQSINFGS